MITVYPSYNDSVTPPPSQITRVNFDEVREIYTDGFYGSRRAFITMSWDRPNGILIYHCSSSDSHSSTYLHLCTINGYFSTGFEHLTHYTVLLFSLDRNCHDPAEETQGYVTKTYTVDRVGGDDSYSAQQSTIVIIMI